jgi:hypothetical protein
MAVCLRNRGQYEIAVRTSLSTCFVEIAGHAVRLASGLSKIRSRRRKGPACRWSQASPKVSKLGRFSVSGLKPSLVRPLPEPSLAKLRRSGDEVGRVCSQSKVNWVRSEPLLGTN